MGSRHPVKCILQEVDLITRCFKVCDVDDVDSPDPPPHRVGFSELIRSEYTRFQFTGIKVKSKLTAGHSRSDSQPRTIQRTRTTRYNSAA